MNVTGNFDATAQLIELCRDGLEDVSSRILDARAESLPRIVDPDDDNGMKHILSIYEMAFLSKTDDELIDQEGLSLLEEFSDSWTRFLQALSERVANTHPLYVALRTAISRLTAPLRSALCGKHCADEDGLFANLKDVLARLSNHFAILHVIPSRQLSAKKATRAKRQSTVEKCNMLITVLKDRAFGMLKLRDDERNTLMDQLNGHALHEQTKIRETFIGKHINLKATLSSGKKEVDNLLQLLYLVCKNEHVFFFFSELVKESERVWRNKTNDELYHALKGVLDKALKHHLRPK